MNVQEAAAIYISKGWRVVALYPKSKSCIGDDWKTLIFTPDMFREGDNIGIRSVDNLVVVDEDCGEVVQMADAFLPETGAVYGRPSKPRSKRIYKSDGFDKTLAYKDKSISDDKKSTLIEIRYDHQDMAPPSRHPDGEVLSWDGEIGDPAEVDGILLRRQVRLLATAALMLRYYNPPGARHDWSLGLAGLLKELAIKENETIKLFEEAGRAAGDTKVEDRLTEVRTTYARTDDQATAGAKQVQESMHNGQDFVKSIRILWGSGTQMVRKDVDRLNEIHALIFQQNGELLLMTEKPGETLRFSKPSVMPLIYNELKPYDVAANGNMKCKKLGQIWLDSVHRRMYEGIDLFPNGRVPEGYYNLWRGFKVEPKKGDWSLFRRHIHEVIANGSKRREKWIISWLAQCIQHPERQGNTAIALKGGQGVGKTTFAEWFGELFGDHFLEINSSGQLTGRFNAHFHNAIFVFADEAAWPGDKAGVGSLRRMITGDTLSIERKGMDILTVRNHIHLMLASNADWVVPAALDERRFAVFELSNAHRNDTEWFGAISHQLFKADGLSAMLFDLLEWKVDDELVRKPPHTKELGTQKIETLDPIHQWWFEKLCLHELIEGKWPKTVQYAALHEDYCVFTDKHYKAQRARKHTQTELGRFLAKFAPGDRQRKFFEGRREIFRAIPRVDKCRRLWTELTGIEFDEIDFEFATEKREEDA